MTASFLTVDIGTSHCRAAVITDAGRVVSHSQAPLTVWPTPPWFPWHGKRAKLAEGVADMYGAIAGGSKGLWQLAKMLPDVLGG